MSKTKIIKIMGFTGTQKGMTPIQVEKFVDVIRAFDPTTFIHGDCIGSDADAHRLLRMYFKKIHIELFPPDDVKKRAFCEADKIYASLPYLTRNRLIIENSDYMIAIPGEAQEKLRSGTWSTIRYAKRLNKSMMIIFPDGSLREY